MNFSRIAQLVLVSSFVAGAVVACGGGVAPSGSSGTTADPCPGNPSGGACARPDTKTPKEHRATAEVCEVKKPADNPYVPEAGSGAPEDCHTNAECTAGRNGRCDGNPHDGYRCTYDQCYADSECGAGVCACNGATRATNNVCIEGNCKVDADCGGGGFCSPTLGSCGHYGKAVAYYCHTADDECVDDDDCTGSPSTFGQKPYCAYEKSVGHWKCSTNECVG